VTKGFHNACEDLRPERKLVVCPGRESFPLQHDIEVMSLEAAASAVRSIV